MSIRRLSLLSVGALASLGCASIEPEAAEQQEDGVTASKIVDQRTDDVTVLRATPRGSFDQADVDLATCSPVSGFANVFDCTATAEARFGAPPLHRVLLTSGGHLSCQVFEVHTASERAALDHAEGLGFFYTGVYTGTGAGSTPHHSVPRAKLSAVGVATFKDGRAAVVHRFTGLANCTSPVSGPTSATGARATFRPFMPFVHAGTLFRNWDAIPDDYAVSQASPSFDRSKDVLR